MALDAKTGDIILTSNLSKVTEDTLITLTATATDQGTPAQSDEGLGFTQTQALDPPYKSNAYHQ